MKSVFSGNILPSTVATSQSTSLSGTNPDTGGDVGRYSSIAIGNDGFPVISYQDITNDGLKFTKCGNATCSSGNSAVIVDNTVSAGAGSSIGIGANGQPVIAYHQTTGGDLTFARFVGSGGTGCSTSAWTCADINTTGSNTGNDPSMAVGADGYPVIVQYLIDNTNGDNLVVTKCNDPTCNAAATTNTVADHATNDLGNVNGIAISTDGLPVISYYEGTDGDLWVYKCTNASCSTGTNTEVETTNDVGSYNDIAVGSDGLPVIAYFEDTNNFLRVLKCANSSCSSIASSVDVDATGGIGHYASITIGADGLPIISYKDQGQSDLKVIKCGNLGCTSGNTTTLVENGDGSTHTYGEHSDIAILPDGRPVISQYDNSSDASFDDLRVVVCGNTSCSGSGTTTTGGIELGSQNTTFQNAYIQNIKTYDPSNPFTISTNGAERLRIGSDGSTTFKAQTANAFQLQNATGAQLLNADASLDSVNMIV